MENVSEQTNEQSNTRTGYFTLLLAIFVGSFASILIRLAQGEGVSSLTIAALRLTLAALILTPFVLRQYGDQLRALSRRQIMWSSAAGFWLAMHFVNFISALEHTTVLITMVLVTTSPLWVAGLEMIFLKSRPKRLVWFGMFSAIVGGVVIALSGNLSAGVGDNPLLGIGLSVAGAASVAVYMFIGRQVQSEISLVPYIWLVYSAGAISALVVAVIGGAPLTGYNPAGYFWVAMVTIFPQLLGHSSINLALRYFSATYVSIVMQSVVVGSAIIALFLFDEVPRPLQLVGSGAILLGVILASLNKNGD